MAFTQASTIPWTRTKALSFDIYGTLIDWETGIATAARSTSLGPYLPASHSTLLKEIEKHDTTVQAANPTLPQPAVIAEGLRRYASTLSHDLTAAQVDEAAEQYAAQIGSYPAFEDSVAAIQKLGKYYKLIALSNVDHASFAQTLSGPLQSCKFDAVYTAEDIGSYKPDLANFRYLLEHVKEEFGVEQDELVHVAQSLFHDLGPARDVQVQSVWVDRGGVMGGEVPGDVQETYAFQLKVETLGELAAIVEGAFRGSEP